MKSFCFLFVLVFLLPFHLLAEEDISEYEKRLVKISEQIRTLKIQIEKEEEKESTILSSLDKISFRKKLIRKEISLYNIQLEKTNRELRAIKESIPPLRAKLEKEKRSIEKTLITIYKFGKFNFLEFMLQAKDVKIFLSESKTLSLLAQYQDKVISDYLDTLNQLKTAEENLSKKTEEISHLIEKAKQKKLELEDQERQKKALIKEIERNREAHLQTIQELKERREQLQLLMKKLLKEERIFPFPFIPLYERKGKLPWPVEGNIVTRFGLQRHPRFKTITLNNGVEISPKKNELIIKAVHSGKVVYADYFPGYGNLVIIDHGMTYYSLYGHCSDFLVEKGDLIRAEQPIAVAGDFGSLKGITLYFEIRYKTKALDPLLWLEKR